MEPRYGLSHFFRRGLRFLLAAEAEDVVPGLLEGVGGSEVALAQGGAFADGFEDARDGKRVGFEDAVSRAERDVVVRVAGGGHGQAAVLGVIEGVLVVALERRRGVEDFQRVDVEGFKDRFADTSAEKVVRMRRNGQPARLMNQRDGFDGRDALEVGQGDPEREEMPLGGGDFLARDDEQAIDRQAFLVHEAVLQEVVDTSAGIVVGDGETVQALGLGFLDEGFRLGHAVGGEAGMAMKIDEKLHGYHLPS